MRGVGRAQARQALRIFEKDKPVRLIISVLALSVLPGCMADPAERVYANCVARLEAQLVDAEEAAAAQDNAPAQMIAQTAVESARKIGVAACEGMRDACISDPEGAICKAAVKTYQ
jgi:hypothetical protein